MRQIFIHIGPHKTGSTTIQYSLKRNEDRLLENKVYLPTIGRNNELIVKHTILVRELNKRKSKLWVELLKELDEVLAEKIIITCENFSKCNDDEIIRIKEYFDNYEVFIIFYVRRQDQRLQSLWSQAAKRPSVRGEIPFFYEWLEINDYQELTCDYYGLYKKWGAIFGEDHILIRVFEKSQFTGNLFQDFLTTCGIKNAEAYEMNEDRNIKPSIKTLILLQSYQHFLGTKTREETKTKVFRYIREFAKEKNWGSERWNLVTIEIFDKIMSHYKESNRKLAQEVFHRDELFFEPFDENMGIFTLDYFSPNDLIELNSFIILRFEQEKFEHLNLLNKIRNHFLNDE